MWNPYFPLRRVLFGALALASAAPLARAAESDDIKQLQDEIQALQQKLLVIERKQEIRDEDAAAAAKSAPKVTVGNTGLAVASADGASSVHLGSLVQFDSREFLQDGGGVANNGFFLRRARILLDGKLDRIYSFQFTPEFGNGSGGAATAVAILDANFTVAPSPALQFKFGKFKAPIGLEQLQSDPYTFFAERSIATNLTPNRDVGAAVTGSLWGGALSYTAGLFNGTPDALSSSGNSDFDNDKDLDARVFFQPFVADKYSPLQGLGLGVAAGDGREKTHSAVTSGYKTDGQQTFFSYNGAAYADGDVWRWSPQGYYYVGPFGALAEYVESTVNVRPSAPTATSFPAKKQLENKAWEVSAGYVLTGENAGYNGVVPDHPFSWSDGSWGAWQVVARYADLKIDPKAFQGASPLASPATNAGEARSWGVGFNWYLNRAVRLSQDFFDTRFTVPTPTTATPQILQHDEKVVTTRLQISF